MPYVNCTACGIRSFALAPWSSVDRCPTCDTPLPVASQTDGQETRKRPYWSTAPRESRAGEEAGTA